MSDWQIVIRKLIAVFLVVQVVVSNPMTLQDLEDGCCKAFLANVRDLKDVVQDYDIAIIDGKSQLTCDEEIPQRRRTFGFYWKKVDNVILRLQMNKCTNWLHELPGV